MKNHHEVGHFKTRLMIVLLSLFALVVTAGQSFAATTCSSCHGMPPLDSTDGSRQPATGAVVGSHQTHIGAGAQPAECTKCHGNAGYTSTHAATASYQIKMAANINTSPAAATYQKGTSFPQINAPVLQNCSNVNCHFETITANWGTSAAATNCSTCHATPRGAGAGSHAKHEAAYGGTASCTQCHPNYGTTNFNHATSAGKHKIVVNTILNYAGGSPTSWLPSQAKSYGLCSNVYCHSNGKGLYNNPTWGATNSVGCAFCHPNLSAGHAIHVDTLQTEISFYAYTSNKSTGTKNKFGCANCHPLALASHMNNSVDVDMANNVAGGSLKAKNGAWSYNGSFQCDNIYCHSNGLKPTYTFAQTPAWLGNFTGDRCAACHGNSPNTGKVGSAAHSAHVVGIHYDDIYNGVSRKLPIGGVAAVNAAHGKNSRSTTINCNICHAVTVTTSANDNNSNCSGCHNNVTAPYKNPASLIADYTRHVNGSVDVDFINQKINTKAQVAGTAFSSYTANTSGWNRRSNGMKFKTATSHYDSTKSTLYAAASAYTTGAGCINIACHAGITVKWADTVTCTSCHTRLR